MAIIGIDVVDDVFGKQVEVLRDEFSCVTLTLAVAFIVWVSD